MKAVSKNMSASLRGQSTVARSAESVEVSGLKKGVSMTVPGTGTVERAPGMQRDENRSAANFAAPCDRVK